MARKILLLEFNELSPSLMEQFMAAGQLPNFKRLHDQSQVYVTDAQEKQDMLEPWIQWVTVHTGLSYDEHGVFLLGDGPKCTSKRIWDILSAEGKKSWVCGSMNLGYEEPMNGMVLPDPWTVGAKPYPADEFTPYLHFVRVNVQEHTNDKVPLSRSDYVNFLKWMLAHGLSLRTIAFIVKQLMMEKVTHKHHWRRAIVLDRLQWDVFQWYFRRERPDFATFFLNSTAHLQHLHWRNMDPDAFQVKPSDQEQSEYEDAILYGYQQMDLVVGKALALAGDTHTIMFSSALGQQPCLKYEEQGGKVFYRPKEFPAFTSWAGITDPHDIQPVMSEEFRLVLKDEAAAKRAEAQLSAITLDGKPAMRVRRDGVEIMTGCGIYSAIPDNALLAAPGRPATKFFDLLYLAEGLKSGMHHPDGIFWVRDTTRKPMLHAGKVPLRDVAPTILRELGLDAPPVMTGRPLQGRDASEGARGQLAGV